MVDRKLLNIHEKYAKLKEKNLQWDYYQVDFKEFETYLLNYNLL